MGEFRHLFGQRSPAPAAVDVGALDKAAPVPPSQEAFNKVTSLNEGGSTGGLSSSPIDPSKPAPHGNPLAHGSSSSGASQDLSGAVGAGLPTSQPGEAGADAISKKILDFVNAAQQQGTLVPSGIEAPSQFFERQPGHASLADIFTMIGPQNFTKFFPFDFQGGVPPEFSDLITQAIGKSPDTTVGHVFGPLFGIGDFNSLPQGADTLKSFAVPGNLGDVNSAFQSRLAASAGASDAAGNRPGFTLADLAALQSAPKRFVSGLEIPSMLQQLAELQRLALGGQGGAG